jgi:hypothetical protein
MCNYFALCCFLSPSITMPAGILGVQILERLLQHSSLRNNLQFFHIQRFFELARRLWLEIVPPGKARPLVLPSDIINFLSSVLELEPPTVQLTWTAFGDLAEAAYISGEPVSLEDNFKSHGHPYKLGKVSYSR